MTDLRTIAELLNMEIGTSQFVGNYEVTRVAGGWLYTYSQWVTEYTTDGIQFQTQKVGGTVFVPEHQCCTCRKDMNSGPR